MSTPAIVRLREPSADLDLHSIVSDPEWRRYFGALADHYSKALSDTIGDSRLVAALGEVVYLIDADVIRNLAQMTYRDSRLQRESLRLFHNEQFEFALPLGAFEELLEWFRTIVPNRMVWTEDSMKGSLSAEETVCEIARAFDLSVTSGDTSELLEQVSSLVESNRPVVERVLEILSRSSFRGVIADYEYHDASTLANIIGQMERPSIDRHGPRVKRDFRDAINLAIVCQNSRLHGERSSRNKIVKGPSYVLVTQTQVVLDFAKHLFQAGDESAIAFASMMGMKASVVPELFPCMSPRRAFIVEEVRRRSGLSKASIKGLSTERQSYQDLADALGSIQTTNDPADASVVENRAAGILSKRLQHLVEVYHRSDLLFRVLERDRLWEASLRIFEEKHKVQSPEQARMKRFRFETESFFKVLARLEQLVEKLSPTSYRVVREPEETQALESLTILSDRPVEMVMRGEVYQSGRENGSNPVAYSFRWPTSCSDRQFFAAVRGITESSRKTGSQEKELRLVPVSTLDDVQEGLIVFTNRGTYRSANLRVVQQGPASLVSADNLYRALRAVVRTEEGPLVISAVRVCAAFGDFQLDFVGDGSEDREVFVISHVNVGEHIAHLCQATCLYAIVPKKLNAALQEITGRFPSFAAIGREARR